MITNKKLIATGVRIGSKWTGKHQGYSHISTGTYWEACYLISATEARIQAALLRKDLPPTNRHMLVENPSSAHLWYRNAVEATS